MVVRWSEKLGNKPVARKHTDLIDLVCCRAGVPCSILDHTYLPCVPRATNFGIPLADIIAAELAEVMEPTELSSRPAVTDLWAMDEDASEFLVQGDAKEDYKREISTIKAEAHDEKTSPEHEIQRTSANDSRIKDKTPSRQDVRDKDFDSPRICMLEKDDPLDETTTTTDDDEDEEGSEEPREVNEKTSFCGVEILDAEACNDRIYKEHRKQAGLDTESDWCQMIQDEEWGLLYDSLLRRQQEKSFVFEGTMLSGSSSVLHIAAWKAPTSLMLLLLEVLTSHPSSISRTKQYLLSGDSDGNTPLHLACASLSFTTEPQIITPNRNVVAQSRDAIDFSVIKNILLLAPECLTMANNDDDTPLHLMIASEAFRRNEQNVAIEAAAEEAIASLLFMAPHLAVAQNDSGCTLLHVALANRCHERVLVQIITLAPETITVVDHRGMLPLHYVAAFGGTPWNVTNYLVEQSPDTICCQTKDGDTPLHLLAMQARDSARHERSDEELDVSRCTGSRLSYHLDRQTARLAELLLGTGVERCSPLLVHNNENMTPLHCCAAFDTPSQLTRILMTQSLPELSSKASALVDRTCSTPLHLAILKYANRSQTTGQEDRDEPLRENSLANIEILATHDACGIPDAAARTPLVLALLQKKIPSSLVKMLIETRPESVGIRASKKFLPIHFACQNRKMKVSIIKGMYSCILVPSSRSRSNVCLLLLLLQPC